LALRFQAIAKKAVAHWLLVIDHWSFRLINAQ